MGPADFMFSLTKASGLKAIKGGRLLGVKVYLVSTVEKILPDGTKAVAGMPMIRNNSR